MIECPTEFAKALPAKYDGEFAWDWLNAAWPRNIDLSDIDGQVEIHGHFLMFETKGTNASSWDRTTWRWYGRSGGGGAGGSSIR